jgi:hypothetical protein
MNLLKKLWNFLFGSKEESVVSIEPVDGLNEETPAEESTVQHCGSHLRFRKNCPDCLRAIGVM